MTLASILAQAMMADMTPKQKHGFLSEGLNQLKAAAEKKDWRGVSSTTDALIVAEPKLRPLLDDANAAFCSSFLEGALKIIAEYGDDTTQTADTEGKTPCPICREIHD